MSATGEQWPPSGGAPPGDVSPPVDQVGDFFTRVDRAGNPGYLIRHLEWMNRLETMQEQKRLTHALLAPRPGAHLLDVGCGFGEDAHTLAHLVGPAGRVVGVDLSETMLAEARRRAAVPGVLEGAAPIEFCAGDVRQLEFPDASFDGARADRVLEHLAAPEGALAELVRVVRPGGRVVVVSPDYGLFAVDHPDRELTRRILAWLARGVAQPWIGRHLYGLFRAAGLTDVTVTARIHAATALGSQDGPPLPWLPRAAAQAAVQAKAVTEAEATGWTAALEEATRAGRFFACTTHFVVVGRKP